MTPRREAAGDGHSNRRTGSVAYTGIRVFGRTIGPPAPTIKIRLPSAGALSVPDHRAGALKVRLLGDALCLPGLRSLISTGIAVILKALRVSVLGTLRPRRHLRVTDPVRCTYSRTVRSWVRHRIHPFGHPTDKTTTLTSSFRDLVGCSIQQAAYSSLVEGPAGVAPPSSDQSWPSVSAFAGSDMTSGA